MHEVEHHALELVLVHLAVADDDARLGDEPLDLGGDGEDRLDAVVDEVDLAAALELPAMAVRMSFSSNLATLV